MRIYYEYDHKKFQKAEAGDTAKKRGFGEDGVRKIVKEQKSFEKIISV